MPGAGQAGPGAGPQPPYQQPGGGQPPHQGPAAGKASKIPIFAIGAIVILVVAVILIFRACAGGGYEKPIKNFMQGMEDLDADKMLSPRSRRRLWRLWKTRAMTKMRFPSSSNRW